MKEDENRIDSWLSQLYFCLMSNFGSYVKALRKASTHLTEEPQFMAYMTKRDVKPLVILLIHEEGGCVHNWHTLSFNNLTKNDFEAD